MFLRNLVKMILLIIASLVLIDFPDVSSAEMIQNIQKCGKRVNSPVGGIDVDPCGTPHEPNSNCALKKGSKVRFQGAFKPPFKSKGHLEIYSTIRFQGTEYLLPESGDHACEYIYPNCNLKKRELYQFVFTLNINYPVGDTDFFFLIKDRNSNKIAVCFEMKFEVVE